MRFFLDNVEWHEFVEGDQRSRVIQDIKNYAAQNGRVVMSWQLDGEEISEEALMMSSAGSKINASTKDIRTLVSESLDQTEEYFPILVNGLLTVAEKLEAHEPEEALRLFQQATEGMGWVLQVLHHCGNLLGITPIERSDEFDLPSGCAKLQEALESVADSLQNGRLLEMAHRIREVMIPRLQEFTPYLGRLKEESHKTSN
ncbi:hypothetical protein TheveDRAFT_0972 [Thermanaerovibrio velox DSM 12556]|uniref:Uncharacterized protein n=1 Tax=Thermanaerovibrio velox DSM 12556 TaxID=926567 RepID=H0US13_9BACT|nr:hypothetical protein [Thermanaerovibrio velox]EHM10102.1 hypothetical protein TheveDRAFT_0972 [Thermanaerovibrio velox DSM 12556]